MTETAFTPSQTVGPYLAIALLDPPTTPQLVAADAPGALTISGILLDGAGEPVPDGVVEIWQADTDGTYAASAEADGFFGFGRSGTADAGRFTFVTQKPGAVAWPEGGLQAPHLLVGVFARGLLKRLVTRMYFPDEVEANANDPVLSRLSPEARETLIARPEAGGLRFDIVLQGPGETTFFAV
jgi:protocatechuate 3,4-dioxygenase alpha subunit